MDYLNHVLEFVGAVFHQSLLVQVWFVWMTLVIIVLPSPLLWHRGSRLDGLVAALAGLALAVLMPYWHMEVGYTRLIALPHFIVWVPLLAWMYRRRKHLASPPLVRWMVLIFVVTTLVCLAFDAVDIARFILGERALLAAQNIPGK